MSGGGNKETTDIKLDLPRPRVFDFQDRTHQLGLILELRVPLHLAPQFTMELQLRLSAQLFQLLSSNSDIFSVF